MKTSILHFARYTALAVVSASLPVHAAVYNVPPGPLPPSGIINDGDVLNVSAGGSATSLVVFEGGVVNQTGGSSTYNRFSGFGQFDGGTVGRASPGSFPLQGGTFNANGVSMVNALLSANATLNITADGLGVGANFQTVAINSGAVNHRQGIVQGRIDVSNSAGELAVLNTSGGQVDEVTVTGTNAIFNFSGGSIVNRLVLNNQGVVNFIGTDFTLGGTPIGTSLSPGGRLVVSDRSQVLESTLADGSVFAFDLGGSPSSFLIGPDVEVAVVLVPEPTSWLLSGLGLGFGLMRRRRS